ncbi:MAG TPA: hypothetical protein VGN77_00795, partial [Steroidobacteraceae bacterium]|nr:hypothetical protein [Steroidobacteraceae bacterium]
MPLTTGIFSSSQSRRLFGAMAVLAISVLLAAAASAVHDLRITEERQALDAVTTQSRSYARELRARLAASELVVRTLVNYDAGAGGSLLRARLLRSEIIHAVALTATGKESGPVSLNNADRRALSAGHTLVRSGPRQHGKVSQYLVRTVRMAGGVATAYFELAPNWLWQGREEMAADPSVLAVYDDNGTLLSASDEVSADLWAMFAREHAASLTPALRSWTARQQEWRGAAIAVVPDDHLEASRWTVIASRPSAPMLASWAQAAALLPLPLLCAGLLILVLCALLRRRWEPVLDSLSDSLRELALGHYQRVPLEGAGDAPRATAQEFNRTIAILENKMRA